MKHKLPCLLPSQCVWHGIQTERLRLLDLGGKRIARSCSGCRRLCSALGDPPEPWGEGSWKAPGRPVRRVGRGKTADCCGTAGLSCHSWSPPLSPCVTKERSHNLDKGRFVWQLWKRGEGESGRGGPGQERVTPPLGLALPPPLALGRKHLCSTDTHILC